MPPARQSHTVLLAAERIFTLWTGASTLPEFTLQVDLPTGLHAAVVGKGGANLRAISALTGAVYVLGREQ